MILSSNWLPRMLLLLFCPKKLLLGIQLAVAESCRFLELVRKRSKI
jgi:hypothetical protein